MQPGPVGKYGLTHEAAQPARTLCCLDWEVYGPLLDQSAGDVNAMAWEGPAQILPGLIKAARHRFVSMLQHHEAGRKRHQLVEKHLCVIRTRLDQDNIHIRMGIPCKTDMVEQAVIQHSTENLVVYRPHAQCGEPLRLTVVAWVIGKCACL